LYFRPLGPRRKTGPAIFTPDTAGYLPRGFERNSLRPAYTTCFNEVEN